MRCATLATAAVAVTFDCGLGTEPAASRPLCQHCATTALAGIGDWSIPASHGLAAALPDMASPPSAQRKVGSFRIASSRASRTPSIYLGPERVSYLPSVRRLDFVFDDLGQSAIFSVTRARSAKRSIDRLYPPRDRFASIAVHGRWAWEIGSEDDLALDGGVDKERRRPAIDLGSGVIASSLSYAIGADWSHDNRWRLGLSYAVTSNRGSISPVERMIALGGDVPVAGQGIELSERFMPM